ncbi:MAG: amidohydrolase family protein [Pseudomonadota bacterium]
MRSAPRRLLLVLWLWMLAPVALGAPRALVGATLLDGYGGPALADSVIVIDGERISAVGRRGMVAIPEDAEIVPLDGMTVLPGLIDLQVHLTELGHASRTRWREAYLPLLERVVMPAAAEQLLHAGVTSARDVGSPLDAAIAIRERIAMRRIPGPTLYVAGPILERDPPTHDRARHWPVEGAADARARVERLVRAGADFVVVGGAESFSDAELAAIDQATRAATLRWYAEVHADADIARALDAGATGLIGLGAGTAETLPEEALAALRSRAAHGTPVPWSVGASVLTNYEWLRLDAGPLADPRLYEGMPLIVAEDVRRSLGDLVTQIDLETPALRRAVLARRLQLARAAGARLVLGSDAGEPAQLPARASWQEVEALVLEAHLTPAEAIRAATLDAATVLGIDADTGSITPGKIADIIAVRGDLLRHIERLQDVELVIHRGLRYR